MRAWLAGGLTGIAVLLATPLGAAPTSTFQVSAQIVAGCLVVGGVSNYGALNFGTQSALASGTLSTSLGGSTVTFQCTPGVALSMSLDGGQNNASGTRNLKRTGGTQVLAYQLYRDAAYSQAFGIGQSVAVSYTDPTAIKLPVYGRTQLTGTLPAGTYTDVVQVTVTW
ncbi:Spore Coat Protein U domain protein [compost metagenome]|jgi:spore coat protein U-like protein|uniref:Spore coat U domain-containing protein n=1 Tax=Pseudomonas capeferrum TaxID=1495066 RepID=A0ABY7R417_9PSED|nr:MULTISPECIES: spore coat U domain-containing protein [Pseudomonas]KEY89333.1 spore coat protein [Pseudomonas capeferrum]KGI95336.1 spore coat protein [Pseudomonas sp. H2]MCH7302139.1 spore coat U domain-containing protein [Pseudomonas capeferrum]MDD1958945.1 spore coat U domain-containing protein [Pseudomonas sp. 39004]MDD2063383.1 spore coat U domain-containing protein [Pseudomonas sp. 25571]